MPLLIVIVLVALVAFLFLGIFGPVGVAIVAGIFALAWWVTPLLVALVLGLVCLPLLPLMKRAFPKSWALVKEQQRLNREAGL